MADKLPERPWHPSEKTFLLAEVIKNSTLPPQKLIEIINSHVPPHEYPRLESLSLPTARSFEACQDVIYQLLPHYPRSSAHFQPQHQQVQMLQQQQQPYIQQQQQQYQQPQHYHHHRNSAPQTPVQASANANYMRQQSFQLHQNSSTYPTIGRDLRPLRPKDSTPQLDKDASPGGSGPPPKKKRGRPTKAEAQAKADAAAQAGTEAGPSTRPVSAQTHTAAILEPPRSMATPTTIDTIRAVAPLPDTSRITIDAITTPAAIVAVERRESPPSHSSSGSSGRRRRNNRLRQQTGAEEAAATGSPRTRSARVSPSAVLLVTTIPDIMEETPARAAMVRQYAVDETRNSRSPGRSNSAAPPEGRPHRPQDPSRL